MDRTSFQLVSPPPRLTTPRETHSPQFQLELFGKATGFYQEKMETPRSALELMSTDVLLAMLAALEARKAAREAKIIDASHAEQS